MDYFLVIAYQPWSLPKQTDAKCLWAAPGKVTDVIERLSLTTDFAGVVLADLPTDADFTALTKKVDAWRVIAWPKVHPQSPTGYQFFAKS